MRVLLQGAMCIVLALIAATACLDSSAKHACLTNADCAPGRVCFNNACRAAGTGGAPMSDAGADADAAAIGDAPPEIETGTDHTGPNYVFVTSVTYSNKQKPLSLADDRCNTLARSAGLAGVFRAWLSTTTIDARDRLGSARGWIRPDGVPFADTVNDIAIGHIRSPILLDESGTRVPGLSNDVNVMTGTNIYGLLEPGQNCNDWASDMPGPYIGGSTTESGASWTAVGSPNCGTPARLYCFGVDRAFPVTPADPPSGSKRAFVTDKDWTVVDMETPTEGLAAADALCRTEATAAGLSGTFVALLATSTASAASRLASAGTAVWFRLDNVPLNLAGHTPFEGMNGASLLAPLNVNARGSYVGSFEVITGALQPTATAMVNDNCADWTAVNDHYTAYGSTTSVWGWFNLGNGHACYAGARLYCFER